MQTPESTVASVLRLVSAQWIAIATVSAVFCAASIAWALTRQPVFESTVLLKPHSGASSSIGALSKLIGAGSILGDSVGALGVGGEQTDEIVAYVVSRRFTLDFVKRHSLVGYLFPTESANATGDQVRSSALGGVGNLEKPPANTGFTSGVSDDRVIEKFDQVRSVVVERRTGFIRVSIRGPSPEQAQAWAVAFIEDANRELRERARLRVNAEVLKLQEAARAAREVELRAVLYRLLETKMNEAMLIDVRSDYALEVIDPPSLQEQRVAPRRKQIVAIGTSLGILLSTFGVLAVAARRARNGLRRS